MKHLSFITILTVALTTFGCAPKTQPMTVSDNAAESLQSHDNSEFSNRKPFKYSIVTDVEFENNDGNNVSDITIVVLVQMNTLGGKFPAKYDLDCEGDGDYEFKGLTDNHECTYKLGTGKHQIWVRGDIPAMWLCTGGRIESNERPAGIDCQNLSYDDLNLYPGCLSMINKENHSYGVVVSVDDWGDISWQSMFGFAAFCKYLDRLPNDSPSLENVTDMSKMFYHASHINQPLEKWDVSNVTNMSQMFEEASLFNQPLENWNVSNITNMSSMFYGTQSFNQPLENWDVSNVTNMSGMFGATSAFNQPLEKWDVSHVTDMSGMFYVADAFNQPLEKWDVSRVTTMKMMFFRAIEFNQPLEKWNVSNVIDMSHMFNIAQSFNQPLENWDVSNVRNMSEMFLIAESFNQPLERWNVSNVTDMSEMFARATSFNQPLGKWNISNVTNMHCMFCNAESFNYYPKSWIVPKKDLKSMFSGSKVEAMSKKKPLKTR